VRKTVTVVFCDVTGSTALGERLDPEALRRTMGRYFEEIRLIVERHGGTVEKFIGDAAMAVFGIPQAHEDDALRAVRAVDEIRKRLAALGEELSVALSFRTGVNTGEVVAGTGETLVTGDAVNVAARLEQAAAPSEILIGAETLALVRDAVGVEAVEPLELKGKSEAVPAFRLLAVDVTADAFVRHLDAPLVGRVREQQRLRADFEAVVSERSCHLFTLLGTAGVGKSRLVAEFLASGAATADVLRGRCLPYGEDITYWPLVEILLGIGVDSGEVIGSSPADTQLAFRRLLEARAAERPQIVVLDDIQWAEEVFLDLVEHVADWSRDAPIFLLCVARPELLELRPGWGGGKLNATTILLEALSGDDCELLISRLAGGDRLSEDARRRILAAADGNPLFIEEMLAMVSEDGAGAEVVVPPTIQALLQARLDRLDTGERDVVGRGAADWGTSSGWRGPIGESGPCTGWPAARRLPLPPPNARKYTRAQRVTRRSPSRCGGRRRACSPAARLTSTRRCSRHARCWPRRRESSAERERAGASGGCLRCGARSNRRGNTCTLEPRASARRACSWKRPPVHRRSRSSSSAQARRTSPRSGFARGSTSSTTSATRATEGCRHSCLPTCSPPGAHTTRRRAGARSCATSYEQTT
jgi:class 3 adenylate cyclase